MLKFNPKKRLAFFPGRIHSAMVSKVNPSSRSVTVEWYERGETKGKEVEMDTLLQLNPEIFNIAEPEIIAPPQPANLQRVSCPIFNYHFSFSFDDYL